MGGIGTKGILFPYNKYFDVRNFLKNWCGLSQQWRCCLWSSGCNDMCNFVGGCQHFWGNSYETTWPHYPEDHSLWSDVGYVTVQIVSGTWEVTYIADRLLWLTNWIAYTLNIRSFSKVNLCQPCTIAYMQLTCLSHSSILLHRVSQ
jgi:hypothetical protein